MATTRSGEVTCIVLEEAQHAEMQCTTQKQLSFKHRVMLPKAADANTAYRKIVKCDTPTAKGGILHLPTTVTQRKHLLQEKGIVFGVVFWLRKRTAAQRYLRCRFCQPARRD